MAVQAGLCQTWSETPKNGFLTTGLMFSVFMAFSFVRGDTNTIPNMPLPHNTQDCWDVCGLYLGRINHTVSGRRCQHWRSQSPHPHGYYTDGWFPLEGVDNAENYCRVPGGGPWLPWCYTISAKVEWERCDISLCNSTYHKKSYISSR